MTPQEEIAALLDRIARLAEEAEIYGSPPRTVVTVRRLASDPVRPRSRK